MIAKPVLALPALALPALALPVLALALTCGLGGAARADDPATDPATPKLPTFALDPQPLSPSPWSGFYAGSELFAVGGKGTKGLVGGGVFAGYNREFDNKVVIGVQASTGLTTGSFRSRFVGYDFAATSVKLGYDMGRLMPFLTAGVALAKPNIRGGPGYAGASDSLNDLFNSRSDVRVFGTVGAGFDYAITNNLSVGLAVSAGTGPAHGLVAP
ncbi:MAG: outer membrane protein [Hyphomicrobiales bacterium]